MSEFWREAAWFVFNALASLAGAVVITIEWGWNPYLVWSGLWGCCTLIRVYHLARRESGNP